MIVRRLRLTIATALCGMACALAVGLVPTVAGAAQFGSSGEGSGQFHDSHGVAIDQATTDVYVANRYNLRVDKFDGSGSFLEGWGWGTNEADPAEELQTCTTVCQKGSPGAGAGQYGGEGPQGLAVENELASLSYGDVYVVDWENFRVEKFTSSGKFLLMFGDDVNETTSGNICA
ncbi:MAG: hypothetical protein WB709_00520, partial [Solirubrobacteraceae bacterium]